MRTINKKEIDWQNTPMMVKFLNDTGKLYNRFQTRLRSPVQRKVAHTIKKMRHMGIIPYVGLIKPTDKIPVGSYIEDIEEMHRKTVDPVTGRLFMKHSLQDDIRVRQQRQRDFLDQRTEHIEGAAEVAEQ
jgi:ribosomal protein S18